MAPNNKQKYIDYAINAIHRSRYENGLTITNIVHHIKITTEETLKFRPLFAKVRAATDHAIDTGVLTRNRNRLLLSSDNDAMLSGDESDISDGEDSRPEDDDASSVGSDDSEQRERRKPVKRVNKKQQKQKARVLVKRRHVDASSDDDSDSEAEELNNRVKKRKIVQRKSRKNGTSKHRPAKHVLPQSAKHSPAEPKCGRGGLKVSEVVDKNVALVIPKLVKVKVEVVEVEEDESSSMECLPALDAGKSNGSEGAQGGEWSGSHRNIREEVGGERLLVPAASGTRGERLRMREAKKEKAEEETKKQDGDDNEAGGSTLKVKEEKVDEQK